jgi:hypothetical protein
MILQILLLAAFKMPACLGGTVGTYHRSRCDRFTAFIRQKAILQRTANCGLLLLAKHPNLEADHDKIRKIIEVGFQLEPICLKNLTS